MRKVSVLQYLKMTGLLDTIEEMRYKNIPLTIEGLEYVLEDAELNYWSYSIEDESEIADPDKVVKVIDIEGNRRIYELEETETWQSLFLFEFLLRRTGN